MNIISIWYFYSRNNRWKPNNFEFNIYILTNPAKLKIYKYKAVFDKILKSYFCLTYNKYKDDPINIILNYITINIIIVNIFK